IGTTEPVPSKTDCKEDTGPWRGPRRAVARRDRPRVVDVAVGVGTAPRQRHLTEPGIAARDLRPGDDDDRNEQSRRELGACSRSSVPPRHRLPPHRNKARAETRSLIPEPSPVVNAPPRPRLVGRPRRGPGLLPRAARLRGGLRLRVVLCRRQPRRRGDPPQVRATAARTASGPADGEWSRGRRATKIVTRRGHDAPRWHVTTVTDAAAMHDNPSILLAPDFWPRVCDDPTPPRDRRERRREGSGRAWRTRSSGSHTIAGCSSCWPSRPPSLPAPAAN